MVNRSGMPQENPMRKDTSMRGLKTILSMGVFKAFFRFSFWGIDGAETAPGTKKPGESFPPGSADTPKSNECYFPGHSF